MKLIFLLVSLISWSAWAQDPGGYIAQFDSKVYSLKSKGIKDFTVDVVSSKLTKQVNDQMIFGKVNELVFKIYWTALPERLAIDVIGLPEGFKEVKEELKLNILSLMDSLLPPTTAQRFAGYKFSNGTKTKEFLAKDTSGIAAIPSFIFVFDTQERLIEIQGLRPVGTYVLKPVYEKTAFSDGRWVLKSSSILSVENGQTFSSVKDHKYGTSSGIGVLFEMTVQNEQKFANLKDKPLISQESVEFKNYKINVGEGLKYFLRESDKASP